MNNPVHFDNKRRNVDYFTSKIVPRNDMKTNSFEATRCLGCDWLVAILKSLTKDLVP